MKLKMQRKDLELKLCQSKKLSELVQSKLEIQKKALEDSQRAEQSILGERKQLEDGVSARIDWRVSFLANPPLSRSTGERTEDQRAPVETGERKSEELLKKSDQLTERNESS